MKALALTCAAIACSTTALAQPTRAAEASIVMQPMARANLDWNGSGSGKGGIAFCVSSSTGRYVLTVNTSLRAASGPASYVIRFETEGQTQTAKVSAQNPIARFTGVVAADRECILGSNARIVISLEQADALSASAGVYSDLVNLTIEPT